METINGKRLKEVINVEAGGRNIKLYKVDTDKNADTKDKPIESKSMLSNSFGGVKNDSNN